jgi:carbon-monoxide dehydrogenase large subunit
MPSLIGRSVPRVEDVRLLTGAGRFVDDIVLPRQAVACFVRSPHAHARVLRVDVTRAAVAPGVLAALTGLDYLADGHGALAHYANGPDHLDITKPSFTPDTILHDPLPGHIPIVSERVRHIGEIVAMIVAESIAAAQSAAELVEVDYEPLPVVTDARAAIAPGAPHLWSQDNLVVRSENGDAAGVAQAFAAAHHIVRLASHNHRISAAPMEPRAAIGDYVADTQSCTLYTPSQGVHRHRMALVAALGLPADRVRVITPDVGGGFGARSPAYAEYPLVVWASRRVGWPVKWTATRSETFLSDFQARDFHVEGALALDRDGKFLGIELDYLGNLGAYPTSFAVLSNLKRMAGGGYDFGCAHVRVRGVFTNTLPVNVYRGAGRPESTFIVERLIDLAAAELGIDRAKLRRRNLIARVPYQSPLGHRYESGAFRDNLDSALDLIAWKEFPARRRAAKKRGRLAGIAVANYLESPTGAPMERADIRVLPDERVEAVIGTQASGQGHQTVFAQVVAEMMQVPFDRVDIVFGDTARAVIGGGTHSDRSMRLGGHVLYRASEKIIEAGRQRAAHELEAAASDVVYADGRFTVAGTDRGIGLFELSASSAEPLSATDELGHRLHAHPNGVAACEVEIDPDTGTTQIVRYVTVDDVGRVINPMIVDGQVHGGIVQGVGQALFEACIYDPDSGQFLTGSFMDYGMPKADEFPPFTVTLNSLPAPSNPLGVKGAGEAGTSPATAVVIGAICDALREHGVRHLEMPATPERIWRAIRSGSG